ncbi:F-box protein At5g07610-like [Bidens hawaiensis]|uniref:F-box protein At5g07610-like n=1 Tax=Bidens hawaiensis TaxID=980011 RepID=UPI00404A1A6C
MELTAEASSELHPSKQIVESNDDLLTEILLRLTLVSLHVFKSVSKRWCTLITNPYFTLRRSRNPSDPSSGLFLRRQNVPEYNFVPLDTQIKVPSPFALSLNSSKVKIMQSCNGLLLCHTRPSYELIVYNPSINSFKTIPQSPYSKPRYGFGGYRLAFDPSKSSDYKIVCAGVVFSDDNLDIQIHIYSSKTCNWSVLGHDRRCIAFKGFKRGLYWNNAIHWLNTRNRNWHMMLDINAERSFKTRAQRVPEDGKAYRYQKLFDSRGCLFLICSQDNPKQLNIYEMSKWDAGWSVKYLVCLSDIVMPSPKTSSKSAGWFGSRVRSIVVGEKDEDSFLVMKMCGKILRYSIGLKTFFKLCKLDSDVYSSDSFQFIASVAAV